MHYKKYQRQKYRPDSKKRNVEYKTREPVLYLRYYKMTWDYMRKKHNLRYPTFQLIHFLYGYKRFDLKIFEIFSKTISFSKPILKDMLEQNWMQVWRKGNKNLQENTIYELTFKAKRMCDQTYKILNGEEHITEDPEKNPQFLVRHRYKNNKYYANAVRNMNKEIWGAAGNKHYKKKSKEHYKNLGFLDLEE